MTSVPDVDPYGRPETGQQATGVAGGDVQYYSDGFRPGDFKYSYGVIAELLQRNPGWYLADGTVVLQDGSTPPDMRGRFIISADGAVYPVGGVGGSALAGAHSHSFTQPDNHAHTANHTVTQPNAHADHAMNLFEFVATGLAGGVSGLFGIIPAGTIPMTHNNNHSGSAVTGHDAHVHANGAVGAVSGATPSVPPYAALWCLVKKY